MEWLESIVGKTICKTRLISSGETEDMEIEISFTDGTLLLLHSSGWAEGVTADGSEIAGEIRNVGRAIEWHCYWRYMESARRRR